jgi:hypothetical protein
MRFFIQGFTLAGLVLVLTGCGTSPPKIDSEVNRAVDFSQFRTFTILPYTEESMQGTNPGVLLRVGEPIVLEIQNNMQRLGYIPVGDVEKSDIAINIRGNSIPKMKVTESGFGGYYGMGGYPYGYGGWASRYPYGGYGGYGGYGMGVGYGSTVSVDQYDEGTLAIEAYDAFTKELVWVGWATGRMNKGGPDMDKLRTTIQQVLARFPVAAHAGPGNAVVAPVPGT